MVKILLNGSHGFIGKHYCNTYAKSQDIETFSLLHSSLDQLSLKNYDSVIHLAALVHQMEGAPAEDYKRVNVDYPINLAKKAKDEGVKQFIFMSSVKVYGEESDTSYSEMTPCHPKDPYGESKLEAENGLLPLQDDSFKISIIRTPVVYGEGVKANILKLIGLTDRFTYLPFGGISNRRSMVYVGNLTHLISEIIIQKKAGIFLASDDQSISTTHLIFSIAKALNKKSFLFSSHLLKWGLKVFKPALYQRLYKNLFVDNSYTRTQLHLKNPYSAQEGIENMITRYKAQKK